MIGAALTSKFDKTSKNICSCLAVIDQTLVHGFADRDIESEKLQKALVTVKAKIEEVKAARDSAEAGLEKAKHQPSQFAGIGPFTRKIRADVELKKLKKNQAALEQRSADRQEELEKEREARSGLGQDGNPAPSPEAIARIEEALNRASEAITAALERLPAAQVSQAGGMPPLLLDPQPIGDAAATSLNDVFTNLDEMFAALSEHINSGFQATLDSLTEQVAETIEDLKRMEEGIMAALPAVRGAGVGMAMGLGKPANFIGGGLPQGPDLGRTGGDEAGTGIDSLDAVTRIFGEIEGKAGAVGREIIQVFRNASKEGGDFTDVLGGITGALGGLGGTAGKVFSTISSIFANILGGPGGGFAGGLGKIFGFAGGGAIQPRLPAIVGERGPELFIPNSGGRIVNGANARGMLAAQPVVVNQTLNFTTDVRNSVRAEIANAAPAIVAASRQAVSNEIMRGGSRSPFR
ncbi:MAG: hypothetical protein ACE5EM_12695 [Sphingomonadales bacterium]